MKIGEAKVVYRNQISAYQEQKNILAKQKQALEEKMKYDPDAKNAFEKEAATLELTIHALNEKQAEYQDYMSKLNAQWAGHVNALSAKQQSEAMEEYNQDLMKVMEVARRLMKGGIVPSADEKKLMEYSMELYQAAKNIGAMAKQRKKEEYDSLWKDEEEKGVPEDPAEVADNREAFSSGPAIVDVADTMASVEGAENSLPE
ncbi:MAG: hypothetical protein IKL06_04620 [Lachnospiraceae bacterium]|nr:hypothetical protein [Lachnospiraceae bacterium]